MYRIDEADSAAVKPAYPAAGSAGYFQDTAPGGGTTVPASWLNHVQEELVALLVGLGGTLSKATDNLIWTWLRSRVDGIIGHATDTGSVTTPYGRVVVGAATSRASGATSVVAGGATNHAAGIGSFIGGGGGHTIASTATYGGQVGGENNMVVNDLAVGVAGSGNVVDAENSVAVGGRGNIPSGVDAVMLGGQNAELADVDKIGWGWGASGITKTSANQNLTGWINPETGEVAVKDLSVGDPQAGTAKATVDGATGAIDTDGDVTADGLTLTNGSNESTEEYTETWVAVADGTLVESTKANSRIGANSRVFWSWDFGVGTENVTPGRCIISAGSVKFQLRNTSGGPLSGTWTIRYVVINPA